MATQPARAPAPHRPTMLFNKTETEYNMKSIRFLLLTITTMFVIIGVMMMILGLSVYSHYHSFSSFFEAAMGSRTPAFVTPSLLCTFIGLALLLVSTFGFFGSLKRSTCMINVYALILLKLLIIVLVVIIMGFTTNPKVIMKYFNIPLSQYYVDKEVRTEIDSLQNRLNCCGSESLLEWADIYVPKEDVNSTLKVNMELETMYVIVNVPESCCIRSFEDTCTQPKKNGCIRAIADAIEQNASVLGVLGVSVSFILLLGVIFALLLARCIRKLKSERALMAWKIREQLIMARMEEDKKLDNSMYISPQDSSQA